MANGEVRYTFRSDTGDFVAGVSQAERSVKGLDNAQKKTSKSAKEASASTEKLAKSFADGRDKANSFLKVVTAAGLALGTALVKSGLDAVDSLAKTSDKLGVTTEALAGLRFAANQTGVDTGKLDVALQRMTRRLADAAAGGGPAVAAFKALGLSAQELIELSPDQAFAKVAEQMNKVENQSQKVSLAFKLFDSEGVGLVNTLALGSDGLARMAEEAEVLGLSLSRVDAAKVEQANDAMAKVGKAFGGLGQQLAVKLAPVLTSIADKIFGIAKESGGMGTIATKAFNAIIKVLGVFADGLRGLKVIFLGLKAIVLEWTTFVLGKFDQMARGAANLANLIPGINIDYDNSDFARFFADLQQDSDDAWAALHDKAMEPIPSQQLELFVDEAERQYGGLAEVIVQSQKWGQDEIIKTGDVTAALATKTEKETKRVETAWDKALQNTAARIDETFSNVWKDVFQGTFKDFTDFAKGMKDAFLGLLAEMAHMALTRPIVVGLTGALGFGSGTATAGTAGATGGGLFGFNPSMLGDTAAYNFGMNAEALGNMFGGGFGLGAGITAGAGLFGGFASNAVFGPTSGIGSALGGTASAAFLGPAAVAALGPLGLPLAAFGGSFLGGGLESLFGQKNDGNNSGRATIDLSNGTLEVVGVGKSFDQGNVDAAGAFAQQIQQLAAMIGGSSAGFDVQVGNRFGLKVDGQKFASEAEALEYAFDKILNSATALDPVVRDLALAFDGTLQEAVTYTAAMQSMYDMLQNNPIDQAVQDFAAAQEAAGRTLQESYAKQVQAMQFLAGGFDGSAEAANTLATGLAATQQAAYQFAIAIQAIGSSIAQSVEEQTRYFTESVMTRQELIQSQRAERNQLIRDLQAGAITDPQQVEIAVARILELNRLLFDALPEEERKKQVDDYARIADNVGEKAGALLDKALTDAQAAQEKLNQDLERILFTAAADFQRPADTMQSAASSFAAWVIQLQKHGIPVQLDFGGGGGGSEVAA